MLLKIILFFFFNSGFHYKKENCSPEDYLRKLDKIYSANKSKFFPEKIYLEFSNSYINRVPRPFGSWTDPRDHELCKKYFDLSLNIN